MKSSQIEPKQGSRWPTSSPRRAAGDSSSPPFACVELIRRSHSGGGIDDARRLLHGRIVARELFADVLVRRAAP